MKNVPADPFRTASLALTGFMLASTAHAQWSANPASNLIVADAAGGNTQPKIVAAPDGGFFVSWFSDTGGYDIHLQKLDSNGNELWAHGGVLVADRSYDFTYDYGLGVDGAGNAYLSYNCCGNNLTTEHIVVSKVTSDGTLAWGAEGITVSAPASVEGVYNAYVTATTDGNIVVAWSADSGVRSQKLDATGSALWVANGVLLDQPSGVKLLGGVQPGLDGDAIASWSNQSGSTRILRAQKLASADGAALWNSGSAVRVFGQGNLQAGYYPPFVADGSGGGVFWDYDASGVSFSARVQHLDASGTPLLDVDGVLATTDTTADHTDTAAAWDAATGSIYVSWRDNLQDNNGHTFDGAFAQKIDNTGARAWGDTGKTLAPLADSTNSTNSISQVTAVRVADGFFAGWTTGAIPAANQPISIAHLDASGNFVFPTENVQIKTTGYTGRTVGTVGTRGFAVYAWQDGDDGAGTSTIRAQDIALDGSLGVVVNDTIFADGFESL